MIMDSIKTLKDNEWLDNFFIDSYCDYLNMKEAYKSSKKPSRFFLPTRVTVTKNILLQKMSEDVFK